jgi:carboxymethylenebutenolidase
MSRIELPSGTPAELALPPEGDPLRGLVIAPDIAGLRPLFDDMCARLAADHGWAVCAVEPYPDEVGKEVDLPARLEGRLDVARMITDLLEGADAVQQRTGVSRVGVLGFCQGGMNTFRAAGTGRFDRAVPFYGMVRPPEQWSSPGMDPLDALSRDDCCPVLAIFGGVDRWTPAADIEAAKAAGSHVTTKVYDEADHGFVHDPSRPAHRADDAADAWRWVVEFLA